MARKILIVDDDSEYVEAMEATLGAKGFSTISSEDGRGGLAKARAERPDLIILDIMMGYDSEGFDMTGTLAQDPATKSIPVLLVTGIRNPHDLPVTASNVKGMLEKPVRPDELFAAIAKCIG